MQMVFSCYINLFLVLTQEHLKQSCFNLHNQLNQNFKPLPPQKMFPKHGSWSTMSRCVIIKHLQYAHSLHLAQTCGIQPALVYKPSHRFMREKGCWTVFIHFLDPKPRVQGPKVLLLYVLHFLYIPRLKNTCCNLECEGFFAPFFLLSCRFGSRRW